MEAIGQLAGGIAHDFNNMLTVMGGYAELALDEIEPAHAVAKRLHHIQGAAKRSANLTRQILAFARRQHLNPRIVDVRQIVADTEPLLERLLGEHVVLRCIRGRAAHADVDPGQVQQVIVNLAVNARDAMPDGGVLSITTAVQDAASGEVVRVVVSDSGTGMAPGVLSRVFDPYFTTKPSTKGTGLGLATAYGTIVRAGGDIVIESEPGAGTTVSLALPRRHADAAADDGGRWIMVVDDDEELLAVLVDELIDAGYAVVGATNAEDVDRFLDVTDPPAL
ncbi:MAG: hybrid sensor histidine kinase/response regulator, partial [Planctomycetes bacterium]|nr:hybrid sensor histidine kinase/response regulator [Planctomycetota bacterium]